MAFDLRSPSAYSYTPEVVGPVPKPRRYIKPAPAATAEPTTGAFGLGDFSPFGGGTANNILPPKAPATPAVPAADPYAAGRIPAPGTVSAGGTGGAQAPSSVMTREEFDLSQTGAVDENAIRERTRREMQTTIDAINAKYANEVSRQEEINRGYTGQVRAVNARSGVLGQDFGNANAAEQDKRNSAAIKAITDEQALKIAEVEGLINKTAREEIAAKKQEALGNAKAYSEYLDNKQTEARGYLETLAKAGVDVEKLGANKAKLFQLAGYDEQLGELVYNSMKPKAAKVDYKAEKAADGKILLYGVDPTTGQLKTQRINFDIPEGYEATYIDGQMYFKNAAGDLIPAPMDQSLYTPDYKNYLLSKKEGFAGTFEQWQNQDANRRRSITNINGGSLTPYQQFNATMDIQKNLQRMTEGAREVRRQYNVMQSTYDRLAKGEAKDLNGTTQAIISTFNKIIDPTSVVRESEYARSPQGQALLETLQGKAAALVQGGPGLTKESLKEFVDLSKTFADAAEKSIQAQNAQAEATAKAFGLNPELIGTPGSQPAAGGSIVTAPDGTEIQIID